MWSIHTVNLIRPEKGMELGLPWWFRGKESTCQFRKHGFSPRSRKIPPAPKQLSPRTTLLSLRTRARGAATTEAQSPRGHALQQGRPQP